MSAQSGPGGPEVLVIDDDPEWRAILCEQLAQIGVLAAVADSGEAALRLLNERGSISMVICDLVMQGMDGIEFLRHLVELHPDMRVVVVSGQSPKMLRLTAELIRAHRLDLRGALSKPVTLDDLRRAVSAPADGKRRPASMQAPQPGAITEAELRAGVAAGEIQAFVQPIVGTADGRLAGAEALARWVRPGKATVMPDEFIPLAERCGLIESLTDQVARQALQSCGDWAQRGLVTRIAINYSALVLNHLDIPERLVELAREFGVEPWQVIVEVTESGLVRDDVTALDVLVRLGLRGITLAIDDFGTGYSSLHQLRRVPFDEIKIDRSFINGMLRNPDDANIVQSSLKLARDLGVRASVAEGVEDYAQMRRLAGLQCDFAQGYYIARPFPRDELVDWMRRSGRA